MFGQKAIAALAIPFLWTMSVQAQAPTPTGRFCYADCERTCKTMGANNPNCIRDSCTKFIGKCTIDGPRGERILVNANVKAASASQGLGKDCRTNEWVNVPLAKNYETCLKNAQLLHCDNGPTFCSSPDRSFNKH